MFLRKLIPLALVLCSCLAADGKPQAACFDAASVTPLCTVLVNAAEYSGKEVVVQGVYRQNPHGALLTSPNCSDQRTNVRFTANSNLRKGNFKKLGKVSAGYTSADVVLSGTFRMAVQGQCFGSNCAPSRSK